MNALPPFICYTYASDPKHGGFGTRQLAERSGLSLRTVERLCGYISWGKVKNEVESKLFVACDIDPKKPSIVFRYFRETMKSKTPLAHLSPVQRAAFNRRMALWIELASKR
jgi:hypothetical protein